MPGRKYAASGLYKYGFNGKENDNEVIGEGNQQDYGMRVYDPRVGRFLSMDPLSSTFPWYSSYKFAGNKPIVDIDLDGLEEVWSVAKANMDNRDYEAKLRKTNPKNAEAIIAKNNLIGMSVVGGMLLGPIDWLTGGNVTRTLVTLYTGTQLANSYEHNRAKTLEGQEAQKERTRGALADAAISWGTGKILGIGAYTSGEIIKRATNSFNFAKNFYKSAGYDEATAIRELKGIELTSKVDDIVLKKGTVVEQWLKVDKSTGKLIPGNYFTLPGADPTKLGVSLEGRIKVLSILDEVTKFLKSTAADMIDTWTVPGKSIVVKGGETQLFQTKVKTTQIKQP